MINLRAPSAYAQTPALTGHFLNQRTTTTTTTKLPQHLKFHHQNQHYQELAHLDM